MKIKRCSLLLMLPQQLVGEMLLTPSWISIVKMEGCLAKASGAAFLRRADKASLADRGGAGAAADAAAFDASSGGLSASPGRIQKSAFTDSRKPLAGEFTSLASGKQLIVIVNHWNYKSGDDSLFGRIQPPAQSSQEEREAQSADVKSFIDTIPNSTPLLVVGDLNDFHSSNSAQSLDYC